MKLGKHQILIFTFALVVLAVLFAVVPAWIGALVAENRAPTTARQRAARDFGPLLRELDEAFARDHGEADDDWDFGALEDDLAYLLRGHPQILLSFTDDSFCDISLIRDQKKRKFLENLVESGDLSEGAICKPLQGVIEQISAQEGDEGTESVLVGARSYVIVWRRLDQRTDDLTNVSVCGFVVDYDLTDGLFENSRTFWKLVTAMLFALLLLFAVAVGLLVHSLRKARREALAKTTFVSCVSHELRTPLTSILLYAEMLATGRCPTEERRAKALGVIAEEAHRLDRMVAELLDFSRVERGTRTYQKTAFDLADVVRGTTERLGDRFAGHGLVVQVPEHLDIHADADTVKQILENLLTNAAKYAAADGPVEVAVTEDGMRVRIEVADHGPGLTSAQMRHVFQAFWRADDRTTRTTNGYGLGLAIARAHARGMGGDLVVAARAGGGCVFTLELPNKKED